MLESQLSSSNAIISEQEFKIHQLEKVVVNTNGIVKAKDSIISQKDFIIKIEKDRGKEKARNGFFSGFGIGVLIMALIL